MCFRWRRTFTARRRIHALFHRGVLSNSLVLVLMFAIRHTVICLMFLWRRRLWWCFLRRRCRYLCFRRRRAFTARWWWIHVLFEHALIYNNTLFERALVSHGVSFFIFWVNSKTAFFLSIPRYKTGMLSTSISSLVFCNVAYTVTSVSSNSRSSPPSEYALTHPW